VKDNFSAQSDLYAAYRPTYPTAVYEFLISLTEQHQQAWDAGTGNGQVAKALSPHFRKVYATDISEAQLQHAQKASNITYQVAPAEACDLPENSTDLITVGQAIHWFNFEAFYQQVKRVGKPGSLIAVIGYLLPNITPKVDEVVKYFYDEVVGPYWDAERKYVDEAYQTIPFPFREVKAPSYTSNFEWSRDHLLGFLQSWSAVQHYRAAKDEDPVQQIVEKVERAWGSAQHRTARFPIVLRAGRIEPGNGE
jgi:SAM-dependent methyltransferase